VNHKVVVYQGTGHLKVGCFHWTCQVKEGQEGPKRTLYAGTGCALILSQMVLFVITTGRVLTTSN